MKAIRRSSILIALLLLAGDSAFAVHTETWIRSGASFRAGKLDGLAISPEGRLIPAPAGRELDRPANTIVWDAAFAGKTLVLAAGSPARVLAYSASGEKAAEVFLPEGGQCFAIAADRRGRVYAASGPEGAVYRVDLARGSVEEIFRPQASYIWDIVVLGDGALAVATGLPGRVHRVDPKQATSREIWSTADPHVRSLASDGKRLFAGTAGSGWLVELREGREGFVVWDSARSDVSALSFDAEGGLWAVFSGAPGKADSGGTGEPPRKKTQDEKGTTTITVHARAAAKKAAATGDGEKTKAPAKARVSSKGGEVYLLRAGEQPRKVWSDPKQTPLTLSPAPGGGMLLATEDPARVWWLDREAREGLWASSEDSMAVTALATGDAALAMVGADPAVITLFDLDRGVAASWTSDVLDARSLARFGRVHAVTSEAAAPALRVEARAGNTADPGAGWTGWTEVPGAAGPPRSDGGFVELPRARFLQLRVSTGAGAPSSWKIEEISARYSLVNRPPEVKGIDLLPPGVALRAIPPPALAGGNLPVVSVPRPAEVEGALGNKSLSWRSKRVYEAGALTLDWSASDADGDRLLYSVEYCAQDGGDCAAWLPLAEGLDHSFHSFDSRMLPDDIYRFRVSASDAPDNPLGQARTAMRVSSPVIIDHRAPRIDALKVEAAGKGELRVTLRASDPGGRLARVEVATVPDDWQTLAADDGVVDGASESFSGTFAGAAGRRVAVRVTDAAGNVTTQLAGN